MVRIATLGLLIAGTTPIALANSSQGISLSNGLQFPYGQSQAAVQTDEVNASPQLPKEAKSAKLTMGRSPRLLARGTVDCDKPTFSCPTKTSNFALTDSDFWLQGIVAFLPNALFQTCNGALPYQSKPANNTLTNLEPLQTPNSAISLFSFTKTIRSKCGFPWEQQLYSTATSIDLRSTLTTKQNKVSSQPVKPDFPKLSRSSLIVSFPQENSNLVFENNKLANPAPETKRIASPFGWRKRPYSNQLQFHQGIDYGAPYGSTVVAVGNGIVTRVVNGCADFGNLFCGGQLGNWIEIDHGNGIIGTYGHLKYSSIAVKPGAKVGKNQPIAQVGSSGWSTGAHLDFRLKVNGKYEDPAKHVMAIEEIKKNDAIFSEVN